MSVSRQPWPELFAAIDRDATVLTATRRLSRWLIAADEDRRRESGQLAWKAAIILPWQSWLERSWLLLRDCQSIDGGIQILTDHQEGALWRNILAEMPGSDSILMPTDLAREASAAWSLMRAYQLTPGEVAEQGGEDARFFARAAFAFESLCGGRWIDRAGIAEALVELHVDVLRQVVPGEIVIVGFDTITPLQQRLMTKLADAGSSVATADPPGNAETNVRSVRCEDEADECLRIANWASGILQRDPGARVGIALSDLESRRDELGATLDDVLTPAMLLPGHVHDRRAWDLSLGRPLAKWPVVDAALLALRLADSGGTYSDFGRLLRSPFLGESVTEHGARALLDAWIREEGFYELSMSELVRDSNERDRGSRPHSPSFDKRLQLARSSWQELSGRRLPGEWAQHFRQVLEQLGWPGERALDSKEKQVVERWTRELSGLSSLDDVIGTVSCGDALVLVARMAQETVFQPEALDCPVLVMGLLETSGLCFDHLWVGGFSDRNWPRPLRPNPLLPAGMQRRMQMPRACPASEYDFGAGIVTRLGRAAPEVVFSWPASGEQEGLRPSPLIPAVSDPDPAPPDRIWSRETVRSAPLNVSCELNLPALDPKKATAGGTAILRSQSACPFQAQAVFRLGARGLEIPHPGLDRRVAGNLAHRALNQLWRGWGNRSELAGDKDLARKTEQAVRSAMRHIRAGQRSGRESMLEIECQRLVALIGQLLNIELEREDFAILESEHGDDVSLAGLRLTTRPDRVDRLGSGAGMIIDYKTGTANARDWLHMRPAEPQLPIYLTAARQRVDCLAFASLKAGQVGYTGIAADEIGIPGVKAFDAVRDMPEGVDSWEALLAWWRARLEALARNFVAGLAAVDPRDSQACRYCELTAFCRRHDPVGRTGEAVDA